MPEWFGYVADGIGIIGGIFAFLGWIQSRKIRVQLEKERQRQDRKIKVVLTNGAKAIQVPVDLRRSEFSRAEIQGRLGVIPMKKKGVRYSIEFLNTDEYLRRIEEIYKSEGDSVLTIPITDDELEQFDIK